MHLRFLQTAPPQAEFLMGRNAWWILAFLATSALVCLAVVAVLRSREAPSDLDALRGLGGQATTLTLDPPDDLNFAGELVPTRDEEVGERVDQELIKNIHLHSATFMNIKRAGRWKKLMTTILLNHGVPADFFYLCVAESHLTNASSPMGAKGFWQFIEATAKNYGLEISEQVDERLDPIKSTVAAARYLKDAYEVFGNWTLVAASYNMGIGGLQSQLERQGVDNYYDLYLNRETSAYVFRVLAIKSILEDPVRYGFLVRDNQLYKPLQFRTVVVEQTIPDLIAFAKAQGTTYKMLKVMNPWLLTDRLDVESGPGKRKYEIHIPVEGSTQPGMGELMPRKPGEKAAPDSTFAGPDDTE